MKRRIITVLLSILFLAGGWTVVAFFHPDFFIVSPFGQINFSLSSLTKLLPQPNESSPARADSSVMSTPDSTDPSIPSIEMITNSIRKSLKLDQSQESINNKPLLKNPITLHLTNGGVVTGELIAETAEQIVLGWDYGEVGFARGEIRKVVKGIQPTGEDFITLPWQEEKNLWKYQNDVIVKLMSGTILDVKIAQVTSNEILLIQTLESGGEVEQTINRSDIERLIFRPIINNRSKSIRADLHVIFPDMHWHEEGFFTIITDSLPPAVKAYRRTIRDLATEWYLTFHSLLKNRKPSTQQFLVIFENWDAYMEYAITDGVPGWIAVGYYNPEDEVLYCFNMVGEQFSGLLYDAYLGQFREVRDRISVQIKGARNEVFIKGQISELLQKLESAHAMVSEIFRQMSNGVLRHELTHAMFHNWRIQGVNLSKMEQVDQEIAKKKGEYLKSADNKTKRKLLDELLTRDSSIPVSEMSAANSWFIEGLAGYMEATGNERINYERLAEIQEAKARNQILPLEFLHVFQMGSFLGMATQSALYAYAQSWALCHFLLNRYPDAFLQYLDRLAVEKPSDQVDTLPWLLDAVGQEKSVLEEELMAYIDQFPPEDPFWLKQMQLFLDLRIELSTLVSQMR